MSELNPYDELPYAAMPIAWTAPESLATTSLLHGGPRIDATRCRVLELGCANGANLLPMAWYRPGCHFTGVDYSAVQVRQAHQYRDQLGLENLEFMQADFKQARRSLAEKYDIIMAHGVLSWVNDTARDDLLAACEELLSPGGLIYLNYNALPGWKVRGMVRDFLMQQTAGIDDLLLRSQRCRELSASMVEPLGSGEHPYTQLLEREFRLVTNCAPAYIAHEYLSPENRPYWRSEFSRLVAGFGLEVLAEAESNGLAERIIEELSESLRAHPLLQDAPGDAADLLCYSQMHCPVLARAPVERRPCDDGEFAGLWASADVHCVATGGRDMTFRHADGREIQTQDPRVADLLQRLAARWPHAEPLSACIEDVAAVREDLEMLYRQELLVLRCAEPIARPADALHRLERGLYGAVTSPWHTLSEAKATDPPA